MFLCLQCALLIYYEITFIDLSWTKEWLDGKGLLHKVAWEGQQSKRYKSYSGKCYKKKNAFFKQQWWCLGIVDPNSCNKSPKMIYSMNGKTTTLRIREGKELWTGQGLIFMHLMFFFLIWHPPWLISHLSQYVCIEAVSPFLPMTSEHGSYSTLICHTCI